MIGLLVLLAAGLAKASDPVAEPVAGVPAQAEVSASKPQASSSSEPSPSPNSGVGGNSAPQPATENPIKESN